MPVTMNVAHGFTALRDTFTRVLEVRLEGGADELSASPLPQTPLCSQLPANAVGFTGTSGAVTEVCAVN